MAYDEKLAERVRSILKEHSKKTEEKKMFGGLCFIVNGKMCVGVEKDRLMIRLDPVGYESLLSKEGCHPMDFTGKVMKGYVFVDKQVVLNKKNLDFWLEKALEYNKTAKASKKK